MIITVEDLIKQLEQFEPDQMVYIALDGSEGAGLFSVEPLRLKRIARTWTETALMLMLSACTRRAKSRRQP